MSILQDETIKATNLASKATLLADEAQARMDPISANERDEGVAAADDAARTARTMRALAHAANKHLFADETIRARRNAIPDEFGARKATEWALGVLALDGRAVDLLYVDMLTIQLRDANETNSHAAAAGACMDLNEQLLLAVEEDAANAQLEEG